jgi:hypothetical protein
VGYTVAARVAVRGVTAIAAPPRRLLMIRVFVLVRGSPPIDRGAFRLDRAYSGFVR